MAQDKVLSRLEAKLDELLKRQGMTEAQIAGLVTAKIVEVLERELTPQEQEAIDNAPDAPATVPPSDELPRLTAQNAPDTRSSVPPATAEAKKPKAKPAANTERVNWNS